jgi:hypothetical protein
MDPVNVSVKVTKKVVTVRNKLMVTVAKLQKIQTVQTSTRVPDYLREHWLYGVPDFLFGKVSLDY